MINSNNNSHAELMVKLENALGLLKYSIIPEIHIFNYQYSADYSGTNASINDFKIVLNDAGMLSIYVSNENYFNGKVFLDSEDYTVREVINRFNFLKDETINKRKYQSTLIIPGKMSQFNSLIFKLWLLKFGKYDEINFSVSERVYNLTYYGDNRYCLCTFDSDIDEFCHICTDAFENIISILKTIYQNYRIGNIITLTY